jgi:PAS domain S-box-containing protein
MHTTHHQLLFVALSLLLAVFGAWTALDLFRRARMHIAAARQAWLATAAVAMGLSIWAMHFVAMLGFDPGSAVAYDPLLTLISLLLAIGSTAGAFLIAAREPLRLGHVVAAGTAMGAGICLMHYVGMAALETSMVLGYDAPLVALSLVIAVAASVAALFAARHERSLGWQAAAAVTLGAAVVGMHYTAMAALRLTPIPGVVPVPHGAPPLLLGTVVAGGTLLLLFLALMASLYDQRGNILSALEAGGVGYWEVDLRTRALHVSPKGREILGQDPDADFNYDDFLARLHPDDRQRRAELLDAAVRTGADYDAEYRLVEEGRWVNVRGRAVGHGRPQRMMGVVLDVTDRRAAFAAVTTSERRPGLVIDGLNHRVKNTLATVQSLARQTAKRTSSVADFRESFEARLIALSSAHNALTRGGWELADLGELIEHELRPYAAGQIDCEGPAVLLGPRPILALGMVLHELATNAAKYGALSSPAGRLAVSWQVRPEAGADILTISWSESRGPRVDKPERPGLGLGVIVRSVEQELEGTADMRFEPTGLLCRLCLRIDRPAGQNPAPERLRQAARH